MRERLSAIEWCAFGFALVVAHGFLLHEWLYPSGYDALLYVQIAREFTEHGLPYPYTGAELRTYGYPYFLSLLQRGGLGLSWPFLVVVFETQLGLYIAAVFLLRGALVRLWPKVAVVAFCGLLFNYYVLIYMSTTLTESLSLTLLVFVAACWLRAYRSHERADRGLVPIIAGSLAAGYAMMVRPGSMFVVVVWIVGLVVIAVRSRPGVVRAILFSTCVVAALALPALPQFMNNVAYFHKRTPLPPENLGKMQQVWGIQNIKYATGMPPVPRGAIYYHNPFLTGTDIDVKAPLHWYVEHPVRGAATLALHIFNLVDQDLLFTYSRDLDPWYRVPLAVVNHAVVALGVIGLVMLGRRVWTQREAAAIDAYAMLLALLIANLAMYAWTAVEMRFGAVVLMLLFPLAGFAGWQLAGGQAARRRVAAGLGVAAYVALALLLSQWVREQSPLIRDARAGRQAIAPAAPSAVGEPVGGGPAAERLPGGAGG